MTELDKKYTTAFLQLLQLKAAGRTNVDLWDIKDIKYIDYDVLVEFSKYANDNGIPNSYQYYVPPTQGNDEYYEIWFK